jgi:hypothetical protein
VIADSLKLKRTTVNSRLEAGRELLRKHLLEVADMVPPLLTAVDPHVGWG